MNIAVPANHPRYQSLLVREKIISAYEQNVTAAAGLIAHGRGEAFDYLIGETTGPFARAAVEAAACALLCAAHPVISVNGNTAVLCPRELVELSNACSAPLEVNLFYRTLQREKAIRKILKQCGAKEILGVGKDASASIPEIQHERRRVDPRGILIADVVLVPLEDGDRTEALAAMGKTVITVDLNPLSRTAQKSAITIVDNILRTMPLLIDRVLHLKQESKENLRAVLCAYQNRKILAESIQCIQKYLQEKAGL